MDNGTLMLLEFDKIVYHYEGGVVSSVTVAISDYKVTISADSDHQTIGGKDRKISHTCRRIAVTGNVDPATDSLGLPLIHVKNIQETHLNET